MNYKQVILIIFFILFLTSCKNYEIVKLSLTTELESNPNTEWTYDKIVLSMDPLKQEEPKLFYLNLNKSKEQIEMDHLIINTLLKEMYVVEKEYDEFEGKEVETIIRIIPVQGVGRTLTTPSPPFTHSITAPGEVNGFNFERYWGCWNNPFLLQPDFIPWAYLYGIQISDEFKDPASSIYQQYKPDNLYTLEGFDSAKEGWKKPITYILAVETTDGEICHLGATLHPTTPRVSTAGCVSFLEKHMLFLFKWVHNRDYPPKKVYFITDPLVEVISVDDKVYYYKIQGTSQDQMGHLIRPKLYDFIPFDIKSTPSNDEQFNEDLFKVHRTDVHEQIIEEAICMSAKADIGLIETELPDIKIDRSLKKLAKGCDVPLDIQDLILSMPAEPQPTHTPVPTNTPRPTPTQADVQATPTLSSSIPECKS